ncbi:MAG: M16 family metallopeptidase [Nostocoides sp.]
MPLEYPVHQATLDNGLRVIVSPDHGVPNVSVNLWVGVGSRHEQPGRTGFAHLFEHLMFQGSRNVKSGEHFSALMAAGGRLNATTWFDRTNYFETVPRGALDLALWLEADRHGRLLDAVNQTNLDNQRDVVKEEKRQRYDNVPYGHALIDIYATVFPLAHPYHHPTIGSMEDLDAASVDDVHAFFAQHYGPNNTVLSLVGDIVPDEGFMLVERYFGALPASASPVDQRHAQLAPLAAPLRSTRTGDVPNDRLHLAWRLPVDATEDYLSATLALDAIGGLTMGRLPTRFVRSEQTLYGVDATALGLVDGVSLGLLTLDVADGQDPDEIEDAVCREIEAFLSQGPTLGEIEASLAQAERSWLSDMASTEDRADAFSHTEMLQKDPHLVNTYLDRLRRITPEQILDSARTWLQPSSRATIAHVRGEPGIVLAEAVA